MRALCLAVSVWPRDGRQTVSRRWRLVERPKVGLCAREPEFDPGEWASAVAVFEDDEEEEVVTGAWVEAGEAPLQWASELPEWLSAAVAERGEDAASVLSALSEREAEAVASRYLRSPKPTQMEVANWMGISVARVSQLEAQARSKLAARSRVRDEMAITRSFSTPTTDDGPSVDAGRESVGERRHHHEVVVVRGPSGFAFSRKRRYHWRRDGAAEAASGLQTKPEAARALLLRLLMTRVGYFYFKDDLGFDDATLSRMAARHGRVLAQRRETLRSKADALRREVGFDRDALRNVVARQPAVLGYASATVAAKCAFLASAYPGLDLARAIGRAPSLITASVERALEPAARALEARFCQKDCLRIVRAAPEAARRPELGVVVDALTAVFFADGENGHIEAAEIAARRAILGAPELLSSVGPDRLLERLDVLESDIVLRRPRTNRRQPPTATAGLNKARADLKKALRRWPRILLLSSDKVATTAEFLCARVPDLDLAAVVSGCPAVLSRSEAHLALAIDALAIDLGLGIKRAADVLARRPQVLTLNLRGNVLPRARWLATRLGLDADGLADLIHAYPTLLGLSVDANLGPKLDLLASYAPQSDPNGAVARLVADCPALLGYSLDNRIRPRLDDLLVKHRLDFFSVSAYITLTEVQYEAKLRHLGPLLENNTNGRSPRRPPARRPRRRRR